MYIFLMVKHYRIHTSIILYHLIFRITFQYLFQFSYNIWLLKAKENDIFYIYNVINYIIFDKIQQTIFCYSGLN